MAERKVLSKYYPADFDPKVLEDASRDRKRSKKSGLKLQTVRLMIPYTMRCTTCGEFIYKGKKFNARKENTDQKYFSIPIYRFYVRCPRCSSEISYRTDPKNADYVAEQGATRNFDPERERLQREEKESKDAAEVEELERIDPIAKLENRTLNAQREIEIMDELDEIRTRNARTERMATTDKSTAQVANERLNKVVQLQRHHEEQEDADLARQVFNQAREKQLSTQKSSNVNNSLENNEAKIVDALKSSYSLPSFSKPLSRPDKSKRKDELGITKKRKLIL